MKGIPSEKLRFIVMVSFFGLAALGVILRYGYLMLRSSGGEALSSSGAAAVERGMILDRNGRILAMQTRVGNISVWRPEIRNLEGLCSRLSPLLNIPAAELRQRITGSTSDFIYLKKQVDQSTIKLIEKIRTEEEGRGVGIEPVMGRIYPELNLAGQIIGFVGDENRGLAGIEYAFDGDLSPPAGSGVSGTGGGKGNSVVLTIDVNVQYFLEEIARRALTEHRADSVMLLAMDPRTGDILGSASLPDFDPNDFKNSEEPGRMDRPALWAYEPGSVFKIFSLSALMDAGAIGSETVFTCDGHYERVTRGGERITIGCLGAHGRVTARDIIVYSCNAGAAYAADQLGAGAFYSRLQDLGFGSRTGAGNPGETVGFLRTVDRWSDRSKPTIAMGQEIAVSALQMLQAASALANDGVLIPPRIVDRIDSPEGKTLRTYEGGSPRRVLKPETARAMRNYMAAATSSAGTGWRANVADLSLAVKTGTAELINPATGTYSSTDFIASCIALLPAEAPTLALYMVIVKPQGELRYGGQIVAPLIREAAETLINYLGIPRGRNLQISRQGVLFLPTLTLPVIGERLPDLRGYSKRQLIPLLLREDLNIQYSGEGWVRRQDPPGGTVISPGMKVMLELE